MSFPSTHSDQILFYPQYHLIVSLPMLLLPQAPCIILVSSLASMIPPHLTSAAVFIRVPLLPVSESYTVGTNTVCSTAVMDSLPKPTPLVFVLLYQFLARVQRHVFDSLRGTSLLEFFRKHCTIFMKYGIHILLFSPIERKGVAMDTHKRDCGRRHLCFFSHWKELWGMKTKRNSVSKRNMEVELIHVQR